MTPAQLKALKEYEDSINEFRDGKPALYDSQGELIPEALGDSEMENISTDPEYREHELAALRELEDQSRNGFTASDRADIARVESQVNRANRGRIEAIKADMARKGAGGSGMELVAQMQSSQDANELAAMRALEQEGMMQDRKRAATRDLGSMSASLQSRDFNQAAAKAQAADAINQFNTQNRNRAREYNLESRQKLSNMNVESANNFSRERMNAGMAGGQMAYNAATEEENRRLLEEEEKRKRKAARNNAIGSTIGGVAGGVAGAYFGGPAGAAMGASAGSQLGGSAAGAFGSDKKLKKDIAPENEVNIEAFLATLKPKSYSYKDENKPRHGVIAQDLEKSVIGRDMIREDADGVKHVDVNDAISALFQAVAHLNKKTRK